MKPVLVDTSVWRRYLAGKTTASDTRTLADLLDEDGAVLLHEAVIGELVLGGLAAREEALLHRLPRARELANGDVLAFVRQRKLSRRGIGWVDAHLLASTLVMAATLWSFDASLAAVARDLHSAYA